MLWDADRSVCPRPCASRRASPKSVTTARGDPPSRGTIITLALLKSPWTTPAWCAAESAATRCRISGSAWRSVSAPSRRGFGLSERQRLALGQCALAAELLAERLAFEQLHRQECGAAAARDFRMDQVEDAADLGVLNPARGLYLALQQRELVRGGQLSTEDLDGDALVKLQIVGPINLAHSAHGQELLDFVARGEYLTGEKGVQLGCRLHHFGGRPQARQPFFGALIQAQEPQNLALHRLVACGGLMHVGGPLGDRQVAGLREDLLHALPAGRLRIGAVHAPWLPSMAPRSQARATDQSRFTVFSEMPRFSAVSSTDSPAKKRSSTICACRASILARRWSAASSAR